MTEIPSPCSTQFHAQRRKRPEGVNRRQKSNKKTNELENIQRGLVERLVSPLLMLFGGLEKGGINHKGRLNVSVFFVY